MSYKWLLKLKQVGLVIIEAVLLYGVSYVCNFATNITRCPLPGSIIGFIALFILLQLKIVRLSWFEHGANWLLNNLLLFFIPSAVGIVQYGHMLRSDGFRLLCVIVVSTTLVMLMTGTMAERITKFSSRGRIVSGGKQ